MRKKFFFLFQSCYPCESLKDGNFLKTIFFRIICHDIRYVKRDQINNINIAGLPKLHPFHKSLKHLFRSQIHDPARYLPKDTYEYDNLCLPTAIIMACHNKCGPSLRQSRSKIRSEIEYIDYWLFIDFFCKGIPLSRVSAFERSLSPIPKKLSNAFKPLLAYSGIGRNIYRLENSNVISNEHSNWQIYPLSLSPKANQLDSYFMIDLLLDSQEIRQAPYNPPSTNHCLLISNLATFVNKFGPIVQNRNVSRYNHICRTCFYTTKSMSHLRFHQKICTNKQRNAATGRRKAQNIILHKPRVFNKWTNKFQTNGLYWKASKNFMSLKPLSLIYFDFEAASVDKMDDGKTDTLFNNSPKTAIKSLPPLSLAYTSVSLYKEHKLPKELREPRFIRINENNIVEGEKDFFIRILLQLREDLVLHHRHILKVTKLDKPPPPKHQRDKRLEAYYSSVKECQCCGIPFCIKKKLLR